MKCKTCGESIIIFVDPSGAVYILDKPYRGYIDIHYCPANLEYDKILSKRKIKELIIPC